MCEWVCVGVYVCVYVFVCVFGGGAEQGAQTADEATTVLSTLR